MTVCSMAQHLRDVVMNTRWLKAAAMSPIRRVLTMTVLLGSVTGAPVSHAAFVDSFADAEADEAVFRDLHWASGSGTYTKEFEITADGWYTASLVDFEYPNAIADLGLAVIGAPFSEVGKLGETHGAGTFSFLASPGLYYASIYWDHGSDNALGSASFAERLGLLGAEVVFTQSVPLPPAVLLFLSGAIVLWTRFRRPSETRTGTVQSVYA